MAVCGETRPEVMSVVTPTISRVVARYAVGSVFECAGVFMAHETDASSLFFV